MLVNKKLGRFKQWAGERMGGEVKTTVSDDFKSLEMEMTLRQEGMEKLQRSMTTYVKTLSKRNEAEDKEKILPVANLGSCMISHSEDFEDNSAMGQCLKGMGQANEKIARIQETYVQQATSTWLESLDRSLVQMKEYQNARKKLETRRLAYDTSLTKMQKTKKDDFRIEEELRSQKAKYEESCEDVLRRMEDIKEAESDTVTDLEAFLDAELEYYDRCRDIMLRLKKQWPTEQQKKEVNRPDRSRSSASAAFVSQRASSPERPPKQSIKMSRQVSSRTSPVDDDNDHFDYPSPKPSRRTTPRHNSPSYDISPPYSRESSPAAKLARVATETSRSTLRQVDTHADASDDSYITNGSPDVYRRTRSASPATSVGSQPTSYSNNPTDGNRRRAPPPPPPNRAKKPPPPPPMKRSALSAGNILTT